MVGDPKFLPVLIAFPVVLLLVAAKMFGHLGIPEGEIVYGKMFPTLLIDFIFTGAAAFAVAVLAKGVHGLSGRTSTPPIPGRSRWKATWWATWWPP